MVRIFHLGALATLLALLVLPDSARPAHGQGRRPSFVPGRILVGFKPDTTPDRARGLIRAAGARFSGGLPQINVYVVDLPPQASEVAAARAFGQQAGVAFAEPDALIPPSATPNDPYYANCEWYLPKIGAPTA